MFDTYDFNKNESPLICRIFVVGMLKHTLLILVIVGIITVILSPIIYSILAH